MTMHPSQRPTAPPRLTAPVAPHGDDCSSPRSAYIRALVSDSRLGAPLRPRLDQSRSTEPAASKYGAQRRTVVEWLVQTNAHQQAFQCQPEAVYAAVSFFDRIIASGRRYGAPLPYYLMAGACLWIAQKHVGEFYCARTREVAHALTEALRAVPRPWSAKAPAGRVVTAGDILMAERTALQDLRYQLECVSPSQAALELLLATPQVAEEAADSIIAAAQAKAAARANALAAAAHVLPAHQQAAAPPVHQWNPLPSPPQTPAATFDDDMDEGTDGAMFDPPAFAASLPAVPNGSALLEAPHTYAPLWAPSGTVPHQPPPVPTTPPPDQHEHWPASLTRMDRRTTLVKLVRGVQICMVQRLILHPAGTSVSPAAAAVTMLSRSLAECLAGVETSSQVAEEHACIITTCPETSAAMSACGIPCPGARLGDALRAAGLHIPTPADAGAKQWYAAARVLYEACGDAASASA